LLRRDRLAEVVTVRPPLTNALNTVGLALDVVGAVRLMIGLFRHPRPLFPG
jgi:hypothetical protein